MAQFYLNMSSAAAAFGCTIILYKTVLWAFLFYVKDNSTRGYEIRLNIYILVSQNRLEYIFFRTITFLAAISQNFMVIFEKNPINVISATFLLIRSIFKRIRERRIPWRYTSEKWKTEIENLLMENLKFFCKQLPFGTPT